MLGNDGTGFYVPLTNSGAQPGQGCALQFKIHLTGAPLARRELFYVNTDNRLVAVHVSSTPALDVRASTELFSTRIPPMVAPFRTNHDVTRDGQWILVNSVSLQQASGAITIALNWQETWKK